jgi:exodeoxyribonuclease-3
VGVTSVYVPNGRALDNDHYQYKLRWLAQLRRHLDCVATPDDQHVVAGDFNIAPDDRDVYDPAKFVGATHTSPPERELLGELHAWGLTDLFRRFYEQDRLYSWWDYRAGDFHQGRGLRIDLLLATAPLAARAEWSIVDRNARKGQQPSDHAPVVVDFADR